MALTVPRLAAALHTATSDTRSIRLAGGLSALRVPLSNSARLGTSFASGTPLLIPRVSLRRRAGLRAAAVTIKCEQSSEGSGLDVWLGRLGMIGFATAISVEIATGKGVLENFGLTSPLPTVALAVTGLVGVLTAIFIFQSASDN